VRAAPKEHAARTSLVHYRVRVVRRDDGEGLRAVARPPLAPAVRTDMVPRPLVVRDRDAVVLFRAVTRPPFAPARFFCAVVPARPPLAPA